jgi:hypothetical protein
MVVGREDNDSHHGDKTLKPDMGGLFMVIDRAPKTTDRQKKQTTLWWLHIHLTSLTIKKITLNIKLRDNNEQRLQRGVCEQWLYEPEDS